MAYWILCQSEQNIKIEFNNIFKMILKDMHDIKQFIQYTNEVEFKNSVICYIKYYKFKKRF